MILTTREPERGATEDALKVFAAVYPIYCTAYVRGKLHGGIIAILLAYHRKSEFWWHVGSMKVCTS